MIDLKDGEILYGEVEHFLGFVVVKRGKRKVKVPMGEVSRITSLEMINYLVLIKKLFQFSIFY